MLIIGLTGSIAMGKSTAAAYLRSIGVPCFDSDLAVHRLYAGAAAPLVEDAFPGTLVNGVVDREALARMVSASPAALARLEAIIHPLVRAAQRDFLLREAEAGAEMAALDIPLLFESGAHALVDAVIVVSAPAEIQRQRLMARPGFSAAKIDALLARQMPDGEKRASADFVVDTGGSIEDSRAQLDNIIKALKKWPQVALAEWQQQMVRD